MEDFCARFPAGVIRDGCRVAERGLTGGAQALQDESRKEAIRQLGGVPLETVAVVGIIALFFVFVTR